MKNGFMVVKEGTFQDDILKLLSSNPGLTSKKIAVILSATRGSVSGTLNELEKKGCIRKEKDSTINSTRFYIMNHLSEPVSDVLTQLIQQMYQELEIIKNQKEELNIREKKLITTLETIKDRKK